MRCSLLLSIIANILVSWIPLTASAAFQECSGLSGQSLQNCCTANWAQCHAGCAIVPFPYTQAECEANCGTTYAACQNSGNNNEDPATPIFPHVEPLPTRKPIVIPSEFEIPSAPIPTNGFWRCFGADGGWGEADPNGNGGAGGGYIYLGEDLNCMLQIGGGGGEGTQPYWCCRIEFHF